MALEVERDDRGDRVRLVVRGALDMTTGERLERALREAEDAVGDGVLELDLREVEYFDSTGLGIVLDADVRAADAGRRLVVAAGDGEAARVMRMVRVADRLTAADLE
ncbi:STAS domain-containing protein [Conexibacter sp. SYSU D00693]|uniref:STAS domain-containing protein n=1 Tax=Conexibacter sp. SYSU D00693 TaxID=2812560 RepID=UPI00196A334E|nr:STAS domain-containing protein [Conexibacter sp. SYSU D00693]